MTAFFVPKWVDGDSHSDEERYSDLTKAFSGAGCVPLEPHERIESITWTSRGEQWTATVGQQLRGTKTRQARRGNQMVEVHDQLSDGATVLAITAGTTTMVITNKGLGPTRVSSVWENPFMAGDRAKITRFDPPEDEPVEDVDGSN